MVEELLMESCLYTNVGKRTVNEDSAYNYLKTNSEGFFVVCDGLGGHGKGEVASKLVVDAVVEKVKESGIENENIIESSILNANNLLLQAQKEIKAESEMKTTIVCLRVFDGKAQWAHVGDTRLYMFKNKKTFTRTLDHSVPQVLVAAGEIKEKQIRFHEDRNRLIRVMGTQWDSPKFDISEIESVSNGDAFLLCTDGFWEYITEKEMLKCLKKSKSADEWMNKMSEIVLKNGSKSDMDNNTAICVII